MPFSFLELQQKKSKSIFVLFSFLIGFYFFSAYAVAFLIENIHITDNDIISFSRSWPSLKITFLSLVAALFLAGIQWYFSTQNLIKRITNAILALPTDKKDNYHQYFENIVAEVCVAVGGRRIESWVINSPVMNAFALEDFKGRAIIGVTEGLLVRLNRRQIEAVVAHEAGHIVSGDCLKTTVSCALAEIYDDAFSMIQRAMVSTDEKGNQSSSGGVLTIFLYLFIGFLRLIANLIRFFISREREYRADAISVRLTRDPLSLAEALGLIARSWQSSGTKGSKIQSIFLVNPAVNYWDEKEGFLANLFSTHPPISKRIEILLDMAHVDDKILAQTLDNFVYVSPVAATEVKVSNNYSPANKKWSLFIEQNWTKPLELAEIQQISGFRPDIWVKRTGEEKILFAYDEPDLLNLFSHTNDQEQGTIKEWPCPICKTPLTEYLYDGATVHKCSFGHGVLVNKNIVNRILVRINQEFPPEIERLAKTVMANKGKFLLPVNQMPNNKWVLNCPQCQKKMHRQFFLYSYPVEVDFCSYTCALYWFDDKELGILQYLYQNKNELFNG